MWCDNFDLDLYKVLPEAREILAPVKDIQLYTHGRKTDGALNGPSCWNHDLGLVAFFGFLPTLVKPEAFWTDSEVVSCTFEETIRDCWPHSYTILLSIFIPGSGAQCVPIWENGTGEMRRYFETLMYHTRKWGQPREEEAAQAKAEVLASLRQAGGRLAAVVPQGEATPVNYRGQGALLEAGPV